MFSAQLRSHFVVLALASAAAAGCAASVDLGHPATAAAPAPVRTEAVNLAIPRSAALVQSGMRKLSYVTRTSGALYVFNATDQQLIFTVPVQAGQRFTLDIRNDFGALDGEVVYQRHMHPKHVYQFYVDPAVRDRSLPIYAAGGGNTDDSAPSN